MQDTYNLLGEGIEKLARRLLEIEGADEPTWVGEQGLAGYFGSSLGLAGVVLRRFLKPQTSSQ